MSLSVLEAAQSGNQAVLRAALVARLASLLDDPHLHPRDLNSLSFRLLDLTRPESPTRLVAAADLRG